VPHDHPRIGRGSDDGTRGGKVSDTPLAINDYAKYISRWREGKGFVTSWENMMTKLMLVVTEVSEAAEDYRHNNREHFAEEMADCFIRLMDITDALGIDIEAEITAKMERNRKREYKHGGKRC
jgi:NTP pyrophosphatase (non-canonical NTP hydrolase)